MQLLNSPPCGRRSVTIVSALTAFATALVWPLASAAPAHPVGTCVTDTTTDRCEAWSVVYDDPGAGPDARPDEFVTSTVVSDDSVFVTMRTMALDPSSPYTTRADWVVHAYGVDSGVLQWESRRRSRAYDSPLAATVTADGRTLFVTGSAYDGYPVGGATDARIVTVAYDAATGAELWEQTWDGLPDGTDVGKAIAVAPNGRTVVIGGVTTTSARSLDYVTVAYDVRRGREMWSRTAAGIRPDGTDSLNAMAMSPEGDLVYVTGASAGAAQFDADYVTIAYQIRNGKVAWTARFDGIGEQRSDRANAIAVAPDGSRVYVTGDSWGTRTEASSQYDYATVAYDASTGQQQWVGRWGEPGFNAAIGVVAAADRVVVTGQARGHTADDVRDYGTVAYDPVTGDQIWEARYAPPRSDEIALDLAMSPDGATAFVTGSSSPAVSYTNLDEAATVAYRVDDGAALWTSRLDIGAGNAVLGRKAAATPDGGVATVGQITYSANPLQPQTQNIYDALVVRYR